MRPPGALALSGGHSAGLVPDQPGDQIGRCRISLEAPGLFLRLCAIPLEVSAQRGASGDRWSREWERERVMSGCSSHCPVQNVWHKRARQICPATAPRRGGLAGTPASSSRNCFERPFADGPEHSKPNMNYVDLRLISSSGRNTGRVTEGQSFFATANPLPLRIGALRMPVRHDPSQLPRPVAGSGCGPGDRAVQECNPSTEPPVDCQSIPSRLGSAPNLPCLLLDTLATTAKAKHSSSPSRPPRRCFLLTTTHRPQKKP